MALCQSTRAMSVATAQPLPLRRRPARCAARVEASAAQRPASRAPVATDASARIAAASFAAAVVLAGALAAPMPALAIPQTSACATNSCDDADYSKRDLRKEFYTKGSLKRANLCGAPSSLAIRASRCRATQRLCPGRCAACFLPHSLRPALCSSGSNLSGVTLFGAVSSARACAAPRHTRPHLAAFAPLTRPARARRVRRTFRAPALWGRCAFAALAAAAARQALTGLATVCGGRRI